MNIRNTLIAAAALLGISTAAMARDFETFELDTQVSYGNFSGEYRKVINSDYDHIEVGYSPIKGLTASFRYAEDGGDTEYRTRLTYTLVNNFHGFYLKPRIEYRVFEHDADYFRFRPIIGYGYRLNEGVRVFAEFTPQFCSGGGFGAFNFCKTKSEVGVNVKLIDQVSVTPFIRIDTNDRFGDRNAIAGTKISISL